VLGHLGGVQRHRLYPHRVLEDPAARDDLGRREPDLLGELDGFNVQAAVRIEADDDEGRERLVR
jgi:hypothetical protein